LARDFFVVSREFPVPPVPEQERSPLLRMEIASTGCAHLARIRMRQTGVEALVMLFGRWSRASALPDPANVSKIDLISCEYLPYALRAARPAPGAARRATSTLHGPSRTGTQRRHRRPRVPPIRTGKKQPSTCCLIMRAVPGQIQHAQRHYGSSALRICTQLDPDKLCPNRSNRTT
jgi:hypothetical protein